MDDSEDRVTRIRKIMAGDAANDARPKRAPRVKASTKAGANVIYVNATGGAQVAGRDIHINTRKIIRPVITPPLGSLTSEEATHLKDAIANLVEIEAAGGVLNGERSKLFAKWHKRLKDHFNVPSYFFIPSGRADEALAWLKQTAAINRPKLRRTDPAAWRNAHYKAIWAHSRQLGMSKADVYDLVLRRLEKRVTSLKQLGEQSLRRLYEMVMAK